MCLSAGAEVAGNLFQIVFTAAQIAGIFPEESHIIVQSLFDSGKIVLIVLNSLVEGLAASPL